MPGSIVGIATRPRAGRSGVQIPTEARDISPKCPDRLYGPPSPVCDGYRGSFQGVKRPGCLVNHSLPPCTCLRMSGAMLLLPLYAFMAWTATTLPYVFFVMYATGDFLL